MQDMGDTFMYRDFQARNVMMKDGEPYFIDFQGGRRGPIYYDVASFVWQARSRYPENLRKEMVQTYLRALKGYTEVNEEHFNERLRLFVLFRTLQVLGAYGFRGYFEKKPHFLASVPYALGNLRRLLQKPFEDYPYLNEILTKLTTMSQFNNIAEDKRLEVRVFSFAYKKGIPVDTSGNGGGYVFDCRAINNPGKYEHYRQFTGLDKEVIKFLEDDGGITKFLNNVYDLVDNHVKCFIERKFTHLQVCFGCTGGQHRSVYCAEHLAQHLADQRGAGHAHAVAVPHAQPYAGAGPHPDHGGHRRAAGRRRDTLRGPAARSHSNAGTHGSAVCVAQGWRVSSVRG